VAAGLTVPSWIEEPLGSERPADRHLNRPFGGIFRVAPAPRIFFGFVSRTTPFRGEVRASYPHGSAAIGSR
jgi:hypothetical protein